MTNEVRRTVRVVRVSAKSVTVEKATDTGGHTTFVLPHERGGIGWGQDPRNLKPGQIVAVDLPDWMGSKHKQIFGSSAFEEEKQTKKKGGSKVAYEMKDGAGSLFRNDNKTNDAQPDYRGDCKVEGKPYRISAWLKESQNGTKYFSMAFTPKQEEGGF